MSDEPNSKDIKFIIIDLRRAVTQISGTIAELNVKMKKAERWEMFCDIVGHSPQLAVNQK